MPVAVCNTCLGVGNRGVATCSTGTLLNVVQSASVFRGGNTNTSQQHLRLQALRQARQLHARCQTAKAANTYKCGNTHFNPPRQAAGYVVYCMLGLLWCAWVIRLFWTRWSYRACLVAVLSLALLCLALCVSLCGAMVVWGMACVLLLVRCWLARWIVAVAVVVVARRDCVCWSDNRQCLLPLLLQCARQPCLFAD